MELQYEIVCYKKSPPIYNKLNRSHKDNKIIGRYIFSKDRMYQEKSPYNWAIYALVKRKKNGTQDDIIDNIIFSSLNAYKKIHKERLKEEYGKEYGMLTARSASIHEIHSMLNNDSDSNSD